MNKIYYVAGAAILALAGLGIYSTQAQNAADDNADGIVIIEERGVAVIPDKQPASVNTPNTGMPAKQPGQNQPLKNNINTNSANNNMPAADFQPLPEDPGVEVAPDNQPTSGQAVNTTNTAPNGNFVVEEGVVETTSY